MPDNSAGLHEPAEQLRAETIDRHRAIASIMEEFEAIDWYDQRVDAAGDPQLRELLAHNRDEEKEHASMMLEWLRRHDPKLDEHLRTYLFTDAPLIEIEHAAEHGGDAAKAGAGPGSPGIVSSGNASPGDGSLGIGSLRK